jgi:hypothetical protein
MAEVSDAVAKEDMEKLVDEITRNAIDTNDERPMYDRRRWNKEIQKLCFDAIRSKVEGA